MLVVESGGEGGNVGGLGGCSLGIDFDLEGLEWVAEAREYVKVWVGLMLH